MVKMLVHLWFVIYYILWFGFLLHLWWILHLWSTFITFMVSVLLWLIITFTGDTASQLGAGD